jgi:hypothetical protein
MPNSGYEIEAEPATKRIYIRMSGHWSSDMAASFDKDLRAKVLGMCSHGCLPGEYLTLIDATDYQVQSLSTTERFAALIADPQIRSQKIAVVIDAGLAKLQAKRLLAADSHRIFQSAEEARAWLYDE